MARLARVFRAIVASVAASGCGHEDPKPDASAEDASAVGDAGSDAALDAPRDSYVAWCDAGGPELVRDEGCNLYEYVPCGLPPEIIVAPQGGMNRCDQVCPPTTDDICAVLGEPYLDIVFDASLDDAAVQTEAGILVICMCTSGAGRRPHGLRRARGRARSTAGAYFAHAAHLEAASVVAFERLARELAAHGVGDEGLRRDVARARLDEVRHANRVAELARLFGGRVESPRVRSMGVRSVYRIARENAVEGCVRETFGALVATWQASHASDPRVKRTLARIAIDEARHAELAARIDAVLAARLGARDRERIATARRRAVETLRRSTLLPPPPVLVRLAGLPRAFEARALLDAIEPTLTSLAADGAIDAPHRRGRRRGRAL